MLQRTKYSRLRNDSFSSLDDGHPEPPLAALHAQAPHPAPPHGESSTLRGFIPRMAGISLLGSLGVLIHKNGHRNTDGRTDERLVSDADRTLGLTSRCHGGGTSTLQRTAKRPVTLQGCPLRSPQGGWSRWKIPPPAQEGSTSGPEDTMVHHHHVEYMGSLEITQSMRMLDFDTRMQVTREAISLLCEASPGAKSAIRSKRSLPKAVCVVLGQSNLEFSGSSVILTVSTDSMSLTTACPLQTVAHHSIQAISFASGGDSDLADFIAYVAKDTSNRRLCYIVKCPAGRACEVISSIGQAFQARFRQLLSQNMFILPTMQRLGREQAEALLSCSGDFLVRESCSTSGQYVLSGMEGHTVKHLLLVHPNGQVRTCDQVFESVGHLVRFHMQSQTPLVSGCNELSLTQPILPT